MVDRLGVDDRSARGRIVVLGASGGTGGHLVRRALDSGHPVTAVARRADAVAITHPRLRVHVADILSDEGPGGALGGAEAVVSALGPRDPRRPDRVCSRATEVLLPAMRRAGVRRLLVVSAVPVGPLEQKTRVDRLLVDPLLHAAFGSVYEDLRRMEAAVRAADDLEWTIVRPPRLTDGPARGRHRTAVGKRLPRAWSITRADLAAALLAGLGKPDWIRSAVTVAR